MLLRLGWRDFKRNLVLNILVMLLLVMVFLITISAVSAVRVRMRKYSVIAGYMDKKGVYLQSEHLAHGADGTLYRDADELREALSGAEDVLSVAEVWETYVGGKRVNTWCYSSEVVEMLSPDMEEGRWFSSEDNVSETLRAVVSYNMEGIKTGDMIRIKSGLMDCAQEVEVIGVMKDNAELYFQNLYGKPKKDYRDCFYTYNYQLEGCVPLLILSDRQILGNQGKKWFQYFNYRLNPEVGFQKQVKGGTLITYPDSVSEETMEEDIMLLGMDSMIWQQVPLSEMKTNSRKYIFEELYNLFPVLMCVMVFILIAAVSAGAVSVKKELKHYAIYYICGLKWSQCARISLVHAFITSVSAFLMAAGSIVLLQISGKIEGAVLELGSWQLTVCMVILVFFVLVSWLLPMSIVKKTSANRVLRENR